MKQRPDGLIERPPTGYQTMNTNEGGKLKTYHNINGLWGKQLWHKGEWAIYSLVVDINRPFIKHMAMGRFDSVLIHSWIWKGKRIVHKSREPERGVFPVLEAENAEVIPGYWETEEIELVCHTQLFPYQDTECVTCHATIPEGAIALWKMLNADQLSEET